MGFLLCALVSVPEFVRQGESVRVLEESLDRAQHR
jgi:hypothetical protein